jgi:hypothetical protein
MFNIQKAMFLGIAFVGLINMKIVMDARKKNNELYKKAAEK